MRVLPAEHLFVNRRGHVCSKARLRHIDLAPGTSPPEHCRLVATSGCSPPSTFSRIARARLFKTRLRHIGLAPGTATPSYSGSVATSRVLPAEHLLVDREGTFVQRLGFGISALRLYSNARLFRLGGDIPVLPAEHLLADREGTFV